MTDAEIRLWREIRRDRFGVRFYRQRVIGRFIVDFYCPKARLIIEIDGSQHHQTEHKLNDQTRDNILSGWGFNVLRFDNLQVLNETSAVLSVILAAINKTDTS